MYMYMQIMKMSLRGPTVPILEKIKYEEVKEFLGDFQVHVHVCYHNYYYSALCNLQSTLASIAREDIVTELSEQYKLHSTFRNKIKRHVFGITIRSFTDLEVSCIIKFYVIKVITRQITLQRLA